MELRAVLDSVKNVGKFLKALQDLQFFLTQRIHGFGRLLVLRFKASNVVLVPLFRTLHGVVSFFHFYAPMNGASNPGSSGSSGGSS